MTASTFLYRVLAPGLFVPLWSTGFIFAKMGMPYAPPLTFLLLRCALVMALMLPVALLAGVAWPRGITALRVAAVGVLIYTCYLGGVFVAIGRGMPAGLAALIVGAQPLLTAALSARVAGEPIRPLQWAGLLLGFAGIALVLGDRITGPGADVLSVATCIAAVVAITVGSLYQKRHNTAIDLRSASVIQHAAACLPLLALAPLLEDMRVDWAPGFVFALLWLALVLSIGTMSLYYVLIRRGAAAGVASLFYLIPPTTAVMGYALFGETLSAAAILGMILAVLGVALVNRSPGADKPARTGQPG